MVVSNQGNKVRICIDPSDLNMVIKGKHYPTRTMAEVITTIPDAKVFSKLDEFLQMRLDEASLLLTTFSIQQIRVAKTSVWNEVCARNFS